MFLTSTELLKNGVECLLIMRNWSQEIKLFDQPIEKVLDNSNKTDQWIWECQPDLGIEFWENVRLILKNVNIVPINQLLP
jgi:hypothetical protein